MPSRPVWRIIICVENRSSKSASPLIALHRGFRRKWGPPLQFIKSQLYDILIGIVLGLMKTLGVEG